MNKPADRPSKSRAASDSDLLQGPLFGRMVLFALPLAASSILQQLFNSADTAVVGRFASAQAMAAVGSNAPVINLIIALFVGLSVGSNVVISSLIGQKREDAVSDAVHTSVVIALVTGVLLLFIGLAAAKPLLVLVQTPGDVIGLAVLYLRIYFLGMPAVMLYNCGSAILRSKGDSRRPLIALTSAGVINVILNLIFVIVFHLHVIGVAAATVISNIVSAGLTLGFLMKEKGAFHLDLRRLRVSRRQMLVMMKIGLPAGIQGVVFSLSNTVIQSAINSFGSTASAGSAAALNFETINYYAVNSFSQASVTFTSQNYAAGRYDRCRKIFRIAFLSAAVLSAALDLSFCLTQDFWLGIFTADPEVLSYARIRFRHVLIFASMTSTYEVAGSTMRSMGYSLTPSVLMIFGTCLFRIFWTFVIFPHARSYGALLYVYPVSWLLTGTAVLTAYYLLRRRLFRRTGNAAR